MTDDENAKWLFGGESGDGGQWEAHRRFISPEFNAIYRQGVVSSRHLKEADFIHFLKSSRDEPSLAVAQFKRWYMSDRDEGGDYGDVVMERIAARAHTFDADTAYGTIRVFADAMDDYYRARPKREMFVDTWQQSEAILQAFNSSVEGFRLGSITRSIGRSGAALSWMCNSIARSEIWNHGLAGDQRRDEQRFLLSKFELQRFTSSLINRISNLENIDIIGMPRLGGVLFMLIESPWSKKRANDIMERLTGSGVSDDHYLRLLEALSSVVISSNRGVYYKISRKNLFTLLGETRFDDRWEELLKKRLPAELAERRELIKTRMAEAQNW